MADAPPGSTPLDVAPAESAGGRLVTIDVLRGLAILWVMVFHLWLDMTFGLAGVSPLYKAFFDRVGEAAPLASLQAAGELVLGSGYQGVAVFFMLSGVSLTLNHYRNAGGSSGLSHGASPWRGFVTRVRRIVVAYWAGILIIVGGYTLVVLLQAWRLDSSVREQWSNVYIATVVPVRFDLGEISWALSIFGPSLRDRLETPPVGALWFVPLLLQYYVLFGLTMPLLRRVGPWKFALLGIAATIIARALFSEFGTAWMDAAHHQRTMDRIVLFRCSEFFLGMSIGYLLVHSREQVREWVTSPFDIAGLLVLGLVLQWASVSIDPGSQVGLAPFAVMGHLALALFMAPLLFKLPGRLERSVLVKPLVFLGVISLAALIVNEAMRYFASFLRAEELPGVVWAFFLVVVYIPVASLAAYPLARVLGLVRNAPRPGAAEPALEPPADFELRAVGGG